ncbi:hypothetical protein [Mycobacterium lepromatosis]|uniref:hypothetical protein n=1 Tax=Mycobacterium lepromatosis TaxID=480418 RepID=UPI001EDB7F53|nr:hypothetical protein [Mycobacterium lepromatosis]
MTIPKLLEVTSVPKNMVDWYDEMGRMAYKLSTELIGLRRKILRRKKISHHQADMHS